MNQDRTGATPERQVDVTIQLHSGILNWYQGIRFLQTSRVLTFTGVNSEADFNAELIDHALIEGVRYEVIRVERKPAACLVFLAVD